jgi:wyosine [tRNA(Phe)-imidazoG37] synthetase (radical SAM superfamily)
VISNGSLCWRQEVRAALGRADWVSLKLDTVDEVTWRRINRPEDSLELGTVLDGMLRFAREFGGELVSETMLIRDPNDGDGALVATAAFLAALRPRVAFLAVPTRPPAEPWVRPPDEEGVNRGYQRFAQRLPRVELLSGFEGTGFGTSGDAAEDLLAVAAVHPMREDAALALLARAGAERDLLDRLVREGARRPVAFQGHTFYVRRLPRIEVDEGGSAWS